MQKSRDFERNATLSILDIDITPGRVGTSLTQLTRHIRKVMELNMTMTPGTEDRNHVESSRRS